MDMNCGPSHWGEFTSRDSFERGIERRYLWLPSVYWPCTGAHLGSWPWALNKEAEARTGELQSELTLSACASLLWLGSVSPDKLGVKGYREAPRC